MKQAKALLTVTLASLTGLSSLATAQDFNGDGYRDLAIGVPGEDLNGLTDAGVVQVLYGGAGGLSATNNQLLHQDAADVYDVCEAGDRFGAAVSYGNFNSDGYDDLAVGVPNEDLPGAADCGVVHVFYGSATGLGTAKQQLLSLDSYGMEDPPSAGDQLGFSLCAGDFNGDGRDDLAIGVPYDDVNGVLEAGSVRVVYAGGIFQNLDTGTAQIWHQGNCAGDLLEAGDRFGWSLAAESFNGFDANGWRCEDLAVGVPYEDLDGEINCGAVHVIYGSSAKLISAGSQFWHQDSESFLGMNDAGDSLGWSLAAGDFTSDGYFDLAIGAPFEEIYGYPDGAVQAGEVFVMYGTPSGLSAFSSDLYYQDAYAMEETSEAGDHFGRSLAAGRIDDDQHWDLVIGVPGEGVGAVPQAGAVAVLLGSTNGLSFTSNRLFHQDVPGIAGVAEQADGFGWSVACADFNLDGRDDVVVGVHKEEFNGVTVAGAVHVLRGSNDGVTVTGSQLWTQDSTGILDSCEPWDGFGSVAY